MPTGWAQLDDGQLAYVFHLMTSMKPREVPVYFFCRMAERQNPSYRLASPDALAVASECVDFLNDLPETPVRLSTLQGRQAADALLHGVAFRDYLAIENLFFGFLLSGDEKALSQLALILYPGDAQPAPLTMPEQYNIIQWVTVIKRVFSKKWHHLFKSSGEGGDGGSVDMEAAMNAQIRALTGGDITKEEQILNADCWRALTELDSKAEEAEQVKKA